MAVVGARGLLTRYANDQHQWLRQQAPLQVCLESMPLGMLVFTQKKLLFANAAFRKTIGLNANSPLEDISPFSLTHRKDHRLLIRRCSSTLKVASPFAPLVIDVLARDGTVTACLTGISPITWDGKFTMLASITPLHQAEMVRTVIRATQDHYDRQLVDEIEELQFNVARELHDLVGSKLAGVSMVLAGLAARFPALRPELMHVQTHLQEAAESSRSVARGLMPVDNVPGSFWRALERSCHEYNSATDVRCTFAMRGKFDDIDPLVGGHLYRITLEAMSNAIKHGKANVVSVSLKRRGVSCVMEVADNGRGMDGNMSARGAGIGMRSMQARANEIGGILRYLPQPEGGTRVIVKWKNQTSALMD